MNNTIQTIIFIQIIFLSCINAIENSKNSIHNRSKLWQQQRATTFKQIKKSIKKRIERYKLKQTPKSKNRIQESKNNETNYQLKISEIYTAKYLQEIINQLFSRPKIQTITLLQEKYPIISPSDCKKLLKLSTLPIEEQTLLTQKFFKSYKTYKKKQLKIINKFVTKDIHKLQEICKTYNLKISDNIGFLITNKIKRYYPNYIPRNIFIDINNPEINYSFILSPCKFPNDTQNVSRVFNNHKILNLIEKKHLKYIYPLKQFLCRIPQQSQTPINDTNYIVAIEKIPNLPTPKNNLYNLKNLPKKKKAEILDELILIISKTGISKINNKTLFLIKDQLNNDKIIFLDTSQNSSIGSITNFELYGDSWSFYKNKKRIERGANTGIKKLLKMLTT